MQMSCNRLYFVMQRLCETERQTGREAGRWEAPCWAGTQLQQQRKLGLRDCVCVCVCVCECVCVSDSRGITEQWIAPLFLLQASCADSVDRNTHRLESGGVMTWDGGSRHAAVPHPPVSLSKMWSVWTSLFHRADLHRGDGVLLPLPGGVSGDWISLHEKYVPIPPSVIPRFPSTFV